MNGEHLTCLQAQAEVGPGWASLVSEFYDAAATAGMPAPPVVSARSKMGELFLEIDPLTPMPEPLWDLKAAIRTRSWGVCDECGGAAIHEPGGRLVSRCAEHPID